MDLIEPAWPSLLIVSLYRDGGSKEQAITEMIQGGYGYHSILGNLPKLLNTLNVAQFRKDIYQKSASVTDRHVAVF